MGKRVVPIEDRDRLAVPAIDAADASLRWHVVATAPRAERRVFNWLTEKGAVVYAPVRVRWAHYVREKKAVEWPLFPGYVFIGLPASGALGGSEEERRRNGIGKITWLSHARSKALAGFLFQVRCRQLEGEFDEIGTSKRKRAADNLPFSVGQSVEAIQTAFAEQIGVIVEIDPKGAKVQFGHVPAYIALEDLAAAE
jgi:transcription antitermination factor NusG